MNLIHVHVILITIHKNAAPLKRLSFGSSFFFSMSAWSNIANLILININKGYRNSSKQINNNKKEHSY